ncbi:hypothetical protein [Rhodococcus sp. IEGM 1318]|uniref:hypothetical protein n=1 Tax=Rhodococcus sp. IEGM 1318 TaxID=3082226 RepID=UPI002954F2D3|nr:hypothetical protein [Rhodococcus sp. IEGM 1318]MDV8008955.1 hypothetical protein [Rhodococcus sp. IEGM 1318]
MSIAAIVATAALLFIAKRLLADELTGRVDHLARGILWLTARLVPAPQRKSTLREWREWLDSDLERYSALPVTKLGRTAWQCASHLSTIPQLRRNARVDRGNSSAAMLISQAVVVGGYPPLVTMWMPSPVSPEIAGKVWAASAVANFFLILTSRPRRGSRFESARSDHRDPLSSKMLHAQFAVYGARIVMPLVALMFGSLWVSQNPTSMRIAQVAATWAILAWLTARTMKHDPELECLAGVTLMRRDHERRTKWSTRSRTMLHGIQSEEPVHPWLPAIGATMYGLAACAPVTAAVMVAQTGALSHSMRVALFSIAFGPLTAVILSAVVAFGRPALHRVDPLSNLLLATVYALAGAFWVLSVLSALISASPGSWPPLFAAYLTITGATIIGLTKINLVAADFGTPTVITPIAATWIRADQRYLAQP